MRFHVTNISTLMNEMIIFSTTFYNENCKNCKIVKYYREISIGNIPPTSRGKFLKNKNNKNKNIELPTGDII